MLMQEPKVKFVAIDMDEVITAVSRCIDGEQRASMAICDCTDDAQGTLPGCTGDFV